VIVCDTFDVVGLGSDTVWDPTVVVEVVGTKVCVGIVEIALALPAVVVTAESVDMLVIFA